MPAPVQPKKLTSLLLIGAYAMLVLLLGFVGTTMPSRSAQGGGIPGEALIAIAAVSAVACVAVCLTRLRMRGQVGEVPVPPPPTQFQTNMLIALAFAELPTLLGFVGHLQGGASMLPFAAVSLALILGAILPLVLAYWSRVESV